MRYTRASCTLLMGLGHRPAGCAFGTQVGFPDLSRLALPSSLGWEPIGILKTRSKWILSKSVEPQIKQQAARGVPKHCSLPGPVHAEIRQLLSRLLGRAIRWCCGPPGQREHESQAAKDASAALVGLNGYVHVEHALSRFGFSMATSQDNTACVFPNSHFLSCIP